MVATDRRERGDGKVVPVDRQSIGNEPVMIDHDPSICTDRCTDDLSHLSYLINRAS